MADDFVDTCRRLASLDLHDSVALRAEAALQRELRPRYVPPGRRRTAYDELVQHLTDLCYLSLSDLSAWRAAGGRPDRPLQLKVATAAVDFIGEDEPIYWRGIAEPTKGLEQRLAWLEQHLSFVVFRLSPYASFDGELPVRTDYRVGERSAYGRSLAFRLRVYFHDYVGRRGGRRKVYFDRAMFPLLYSLDNSLGGVLGGELPQRDDGALSRAVQQILLHGHELFMAFRRANGWMPGSGGRYVLVYRLAGESPPGLDRRRRVRRRVARDEEHVDTGSNRLGIRLLQLGLWRAGFYEGALDGAFGPLSHRALVGLIEQEYSYGEGTVGRRKLERLLLPIEDGTARWAVDLRTLTRLLVAYAPPSLSEAEEEEGRLWQAIRVSGREAQLDEALQRAPAVAPPGNRPHRRVYYGLRGLIRGAFRAVGKVVAWLAGRVAELLGAVYDFIKATAKRLWEGAGMFVRGFGYLLHFLLGRPFVTEGVALTRFSLDFDTVSMIDAAAGADELARHTGRLARAQRAAAYFIEVATGVVRMVATLQPPISWWRLGIRIARWVWRWLSERAMARRTAPATPPVA